MARTILMSIMAVAFAGMLLVGNASTGKEGVMIERGRYLVQIGGCNDCHTAGYAPREGEVPESEWLLGDQLGFRGAWGTTYPINLRLYMANMTEAQWLAVVRQMRSRPPMPWFNLAAMSDDDLRALYRYIRTLQPLGEPAPAYLPPEQEPPPPFVQFP